MSGPTFTRRMFIGAVGAILAAPEASLARRRLTVTALGDSMSDIVFFPDCYPHWLPRYLPGVKVVALGEGGDRTEEVLARCRPDGIVDYLVIDRLLGLEPHPVQPGQCTAVLVGINDVLHGDPATRIVANLSRIYGYLHRHGSRPFPITILPWASSPSFRSRGESTRLTVNDWIRRQPYAIDVERLMGNGRTPPALKPEFNGGDGIHPVGEGPKVLARAVAREIRRHEPR
jgi:GDSL-like Lipase/Acylhydrolase family